MVQTQIELDPEQYEQLKRQAEAERKSLSQMVREAVTVYLERRTAPVKEAADVQKSHRVRRPLQEVLGKYTPLPEAEQQDLKDHDRWYTDTIR